jgi:hypothetical protein
MSASYRHTLNLLIVNYGVNLFKASVAYAELNSVLATHLTASVMPLKPVFFNSQ